MGGAEEGNGRSRNSQNILGKVGRWIWFPSNFPKGFGKGTPTPRNALRFLSPASPTVSEPRIPSSPSPDHTEEGPWAREV